MPCLIAIDGVDASGKQTHTNLLYERLKREGIRVRQISFPMYKSPSSEVVKMYLSGQFGEKPEDVDAYAASTFFALDRYATYRADWGSDYESGTVILADRYVSSNMIHQAGKISDRAQKDRFLDWIYEFEYGVYHLPKPDAEIFLDMPVVHALELMKNRTNKINGEAQKDIHERDAHFLQASYENALYVAKKYHWLKINCVENGAVRPFEEISEEIYRAVIEKIRQKVN